MSISFGKRRVSFDEEVKVIDLEDDQAVRESRVGHWHLDGARFRMRIVQMEQMLRPLFNPQETSSNPTDKKSCLREEMSVPMRIPREEERTNRLDG